MIMKKTILLATCMVLLASKAYSQGLFHFSNLGGMLTRIGSVDGPLAGPEIWAQMLAGPRPDSLAPVGVPIEHLLFNGVPTGAVSDGAVAVPGILPFETAYVKMLAWDGTRWGTVLSGVPPDQLGMTDIVPVFLTDNKIGFPRAPHFTQPAIVPIPEPSAFALVLVGGAALFLSRTRRRQ